MPGKTWVCVGAMFIGAAAMLGGCGGGEEAAPVLTPTSLAMQATATVSPSPEPTLTIGMAELIAQERARLEGLGWTLSCSHGVTEISGTFDSVNDHWVTVYCLPSDSPGINEEERLVIYERQGTTLVPIFEQEEPRETSRLTDFHFWGPEPESAPELTDINGDGLNEVVVWLAMHGTCTDCGDFHIYTVQNHEVVEVPVHLPITGLLGYDGNNDGTAVHPMNLQDLDGDGKYEVIATDASWQIHGFANCCDPHASFVLAWDGQRYEDASSEFASYFDDTIDTLEAELSGADGGDETLMRIAISILLNYGNSGRAQEGWQHFEELVQPEKLQTQCWREALPLFVADLELSVPRDGQPPVGGAAGSPQLHGPVCLEP